jgi:hypothetical protein
VIRTSNWQQIAGEKDMITFKTERLTVIFQQEVRISAWNKENVEYAFPNLDI